ncbi:MAG: metallophosphoesterase family protein [Clostridia bacterium]|nr:metallophosphoesterase family protein [Clostridia bacterium]
MKIALIADLHGNYPATLAMDRELNRLQPDEIWFLGDAVGKGPQSRDTCDWVRQNCTRFVGGNWDYGIGGKEFPADDYYWSQLGPERMQWLRELPREMEALISGTRFRLFHGRPVTPLMYDSTDWAMLSAPFQAHGETYGGVIFADSHRPFLRTLDAGYILNTGSVGNSLGVPKAHGILIDGELDSETPAPMLMSILSVPYDNEAAADVARNDPELPFREAYITEVTTGIYSR